MSDEEKRNGARPSTIEEALQLVGDVRIPAETFVTWIRTVGTMPCQFGAALYVAMNEQLNAAIVATTSQGAPPLL